MIKPYTAIGLIPTVRGIRKRGDIKINLEHLTHMVKAASWLSSLDIPVRLIAFRTLRASRTSSRTSAGSFASSSSKTSSASATKRLTRSASSCFNWRSP